MPRSEVRRDYTVLRWTQLALALNAGDLDKAMFHFVNSTWAEVRT